MTAIVYTGALKVETIPGEYSYHQQRRYSLLVTRASFKRFLHWSLTITFASNYLFPQPICILSHSILPKKLCRGAWWCLVDVEMFSTSVWMLGQ